MLKLLQYFSTFKLSFTWRLVSLHLGYIDRLISSQTQHTAHAPNLRRDWITAKFSIVIPKHSDWSVMMS